MTGVIHEKQLDPRRPDVVDRRSVLHRHARIFFLYGVSTAFLVVAATLAVVAVIVFARSAPAPRPQSD